MTPTSASASRTGSIGIIVAGDNYGQGSSREHAALAPLFLGVKAVVAKSFARIHRRNLVAQGIVPLTFKDESDYDKAEVEQCWEFPDLRQELEEGSDTIKVKIDDGDELELTPRLLRERARDPLAGGLLSYLREQDSAERRTAARASSTPPQRRITSSAWTARPTRPRRS